MVYRKEIIVAREWREWSLVKNAWRRTTMNPDTDMDVFGIWYHGQDLTAIRQRMLFVHASTLAAAFFCSFTCLGLSLSWGYHQSRLSSLFLSAFSYIPLGMTAVFSSCISLMPSSVLLRQCKCFTSPLPNFHNHNQDVSGLRPRHSISSVPKARHELTSPSSVLPEHIRPLLLHASSMHITGSILHNCTSITGSFVSHSPLLPPPLFSPCVFYDLRDINDRALSAISTAPVTVTRERERERESRDRRNCAEMVETTRLQRLASMPQTEAFQFDTLLQGI